MFSCMQEVQYIIIFAEQKKKNACTKFISDKETELIKDLQMLNAGTFFGDV